MREARYGDICILIRSRTHLRRSSGRWRKAACRTASKAARWSWRRQEVRDLLAGLRAIDDPSDQVALVGALRSPAFACSDPDLLRWVEGGGRLSYEEPGDRAGRPGQGGASLPGRLPRAAAPALAAGPDRGVHRERLLVASAFGRAAPARVLAAAALRRVDSARSFTATGRHSLRAFLDWIDGLERAEARDVESAEAEPDEVAVRILTIHRSKGLEFPIVLLAGLGARACRSPARASR